MVPNPNPTCTAPKSPSGAPRASEDPDQLQNDIEACDADERALTRLLRLAFQLQGALDQPPNAKCRRAQLLERASIAGGISNILEGVPSITQRLMRHAKGTAGPALSSLARDPALSMDRRPSR